MYKAFLGAGLALAVGGSVIFFYGLLGGLSGNPHSYFANFLFLVSPGMLVLGCVMVLLSGVIGFLTGRANTQVSSGQTAAPHVRKTSRLTKMCAAFTFLCAITTVLGGYLLMHTTGMSFLVPVGVLLLMYSPVGFLLGTIAVGISIIINR